MAFLVYQGRIKKRKPLERVALYSSLLKILFNPLKGQVAVYNALAKTFPYVARDLDFFSAFHSNLSACSN